MDFRKRITKSFSSLFLEQVDMGDDEIEGGFGQFWKYYIWISQLAEDQVWKIDTITSLPLVVCLNHLAYLMDLRTEQDKQIKKQMNRK